MKTPIGNFPISLPENFSFQHGPLPPPNGGPGTCLACGDFYSALRFSILAGRDILVHIPCQYDRVFVWQHEFVYSEEV